MVRWYEGVGVRHSGTASASSRAFGGRLTRIAAATTRYCRQLLRPAGRTAMMNDAFEFSEQGLKAEMFLPSGGSFAFRKLYIPRIVLWRSKELQGSKEEN